MVIEAAQLSQKVFSKGIEKKSTRDGYGDGLLEVGKLNTQVVALSADLAESTRAHLFAKEFPDRFFQVGVAEQNMAGLAAGLALGGKIPFMSSFAVFSPGRNWEQIRVSIAYSNLNVKVVGSHSGFSNGPDGATHQALEDIALMRVMPNFVVLVPVDALETKKAVLAAADYDGPVYIRTARNESPLFTTPQTPFEIGKAQLFMEGRDLSIIGSGPILYSAMEAVRELELDNHFSCDVINLSTVKPLDEETVLESVKKTGRVMVVEEHQRIGGVGGAIAEFLSDKYPVPITRIGVEDVFGESGQPSELLEKYGLSKNHILREIKDVLARSR